MTLDTLILRSRFACSGLDDNDCAMRHDGHKFTVVRTLPMARYADPGETPEDMYRVRFEDGEECEAFHEEVYA